MTLGQDPDSSLTLVVRRTIDGDVDAVFQAWTKPEHIMKWWGPAQVTCTACDVDLRVGGTYRIANEFADGSVLWITGRFERIEAPHLLVFTWHTDPPAIQSGAVTERVCVRFVDRAGKTEVIVEHSRIVNRTAQRSHEAGWLGCLEGLRNYLQ